MIPTLRRRTRVEPLPPGVVGVPIGVRYEQLQPRPQGYRGRHRRLLFWRSK